MRCLVGTEREIIYPTKPFRALFKNTDNTLPKGVKINVDQQFNHLLLQLLKAPTEVQYISLIMNLISLMKMEVLRKTISLFTAKGDTTVSEVLQQCQICCKEKGHLHYPLHYLTIAFLFHVQEKDGPLCTTYTQTTGASGISLKLV